MPSPSPYSTNFYATYADKSYRSASLILPTVMDLIAPKTIVDVGCGVGTWLRAWEDLGVSSILGVDGDYVDRNELLVDKAKFMAMDLSKPRDLAGAPFELAQSLEVAEHLPPDCAEGFVRFLCSLSPVVLFSAAIPYQGGNHHVNEQWPEYWADLFSDNGYTVFDVVRSKVWSDERVEYYYAQNTFLYVKQDRIIDYPKLTMDAVPADHRQLARVHPRKWEDLVHKTPKLERLIASIPKSSVEFGRRIFRRVQTVLQ